MVILTFSSLLLSLSEVISLGIIIPIMILFVSPEKMHTNKLIIGVKRLTGINSDQQFLCFLIITAVFLYIAKCIFALFAYRGQQRFVGNIYNRLTSKALATYLHKPYAFFLVTNSSVLFKNLVTEVHLFSFLFLSSYITLISEFIFFLAAIALLFVAYPLATVSLGTIFLVFAAFINFFVKKRIEGYARTRVKFSEEKYRFAMEAFNAAKEIKAYNVQDFFVHRFANSTRKFTDGFVKFSTLSLLPRYILEATIFSSILLFLLFCILSHKSPAEIIPMMTIIAALSLRLLPSFRKVYLSMSNIQYNSKSVEIVFGILKDGEEIIRTRVCVKSLDTSEKETNTIKLESVSFRYDSASSAIFEDLNITIPLQQTSAFLGTTGAGKSTLIDIIMGLLIPSAGRLLYKQQIISPDNIEAYRKKIGYVPQQIFLSDDTLETNIAFGLTNDMIDKTQLERVIRISQLTSFVNSLELGLKTVVGEKGVRLSGGQKQRIGIARALYRNPEILILDEATSALDENTETRLQEALRQIPGGLTLIVITHRLSAIEHADMIYLLENGKMVAQGKFDQLAKDPIILQKISQKRFYVQNK